MDYFMHSMGSGPVLGFWFLDLTPFYILLAFWSVFWKGLALWHAAKRDRGWWFIALLLINTAGILELIYLFGIEKIPTSQLFDTKIKKSKDTK